MDLTPRYNEHLRYPKAVVTASNTTGKGFILRSITWPTDYPSCSKYDANDLDLCSNAAPIINTTFYDDLVDNLECFNDSGYPIQVNKLDTSSFQNPLENNLIISDLKGNGTFCSLFVHYINNIDEMVIRCNIKENQYIGPCYTIQGSHAATFFTYLVLRISFQVFINGMYTLIDGTTMHLVKKHNGNYPLVLLWNSLAGVLGPLISGALVEDSEDPSRKLHIFQLFNLHNYY